MKGQSDDEAAVRFGHQIAGAGVHCVAERHRRRRQRQDLAADRLYADFGA